MLKDKVVIKQMKKARIRQRIRKTVQGTAERPRLHVFKSNRYMYTQAVNDENGTILAAASTLEKDFRAVHQNTRNLSGCEKLGEIMARRLKDKNIAKIVFDRGIYPYHGRIKVLAEALRKGGLTF